MVIFRSSWRFLGQSPNHGSVPYPFSPRWQDVASVTEPLRSLSSFWKCFSRSLFCLRRHQCFTRKQLPCQGWQGQERWRDAFLFDIHLMDQSGSIKTHKKKSAILIHVLSRQEDHLLPFQYQSHFVFRVVQCKVVVISSNYIQFAELYRGRKNIKDPQTRPIYLYIGDFIISHRIHVWYIW